MVNKILIIGASGLVGRYLFNYFKKEGNVAGTYFDEKIQELPYYLDIADPNFEEIPIEDFDYAVICSAVAKIEECKKNLDYARKVNVLGSEKVISYLSEHNVTPIFMSGAAVFGGGGGKKEEDERNPLNVYGKQKAEVEDFIRSNIKRYLIVRPGKIFGKMKGEGGLFADWLLKYKNKEKILCAYDENMSLTYAEDFARVIDVLIKRKMFGVYHINPQEHFSRYDIAKRFFDYLRIKDVKLKKCSIDDFKFEEKRSKNAFLDASKFIGETGFSFTPIEKCFDMIASSQ